MMKPTMSIKYYEEKISQHEKLLKLIRDDLLMRAEVEGDGTKVVDLSDGIWFRLNKAIGD